MIDLSAPIIPGVSAAGFHIGQFIERKGPIGTPFAREPIHNPFARSSEEVRYHCESVDLWVANSVIQQIGVHGAYCGDLFGQIMPGMTIEDIRATCKKQSQAWDVLYITVCEPIRPTSRNAWCERWLTVSPCEKPRAALVWR